MGAEICRRLSSGESLRAICRDDGFPDESTVRMWVLRENSDFYPQYAIARQMQALRWAEEIIEIADDGSNDWMQSQRPDNKGYELNGEHTRRSHMRVEARKWLLSKVLPKVYGDRQQHTHTGPNDGPIGVASVTLDAATDMTEEQRAALRAALTGAKR